MVKGQSTLAYFCVMVIFLGGQVKLSLIFRPYKKGYLQQMVRPLDKKLNNTGIAKIGCYSRLCKAVFSENLDCKEELNLMLEISDF